MFILKDVELGLYVHIPFCKSKCPYCDFFSLTRLPEENLYLKALLKEIKLLKGFLEEKFNISHIFIKTFYAGGGTPTLLSPHFYEKLFYGISKYFYFNPEELTIEANPETLTLEKTIAYREVGFNRISLGVQTFQEKGLRFLQRAHTRKDILLSLEYIVKANFNNFSLDLIYGWQAQGIKTLEKDLEMLLNYQPPHLSFYELTLYPGTPLHKKYQGKAPFLKEKRLIKLAKFIRNFLKENQYIQYEISNYAKKGLECKHNLIYWKVEPYLGVGAGAVSRIGYLRFQNEENLDLYYHKLLKVKQFCFKILENLDNLELAKEKLFMGLRLTEGFNFTELEKLNVRINEKALEIMLEEGFIEICEGKIHLTEKGSFLHNQVVKFLWEALERLK
ncbi:MAG: radical SAM family heme chaperone HemW [Caldimicrobium sp.]